MTHQEIIINDVRPTTGDPSLLSTTAKDNLVNAINELLTKVNANYITINQKINSASANFNQTII